MNMGKKEKNNEVFDSFRDFLKCIIEDGISRDEKLGKTYIGTLGFSEDEISSWQKRGYVDLKNSRFNKEGVVLTEQGKFEYGMEKLQKKFRKDLEKYA